MALRAQAGTSDLTNEAFERAANAFEALVRNGDPEAVDRGFRRTIAATAYHLAGYSAVAYSLFKEAAEDLNSAPGEIAMMRLVLRDLGGLRTFVREWLNDEAHRDDQTAEALRGEDVAPSSLRRYAPAPNQPRRFASVRPTPQRVALCSDQERCHDKFTAGRPPKPIEETGPPNTHCDGGLTPSR